MEKRKIPPFVWILLTSCSIFAYAFLYQTSVANYGTAPSAFSKKDQDSPANDDEQASKILLPDVELVKNILNLTKIVLPSE